MENIPSFLPIVYGALGGAASAGVFKGPIQTLEDWWYVNFGYEQSTKRAKLVAKQEANIEKLKEEILDNAIEINPNDVQEPQLKILGPALEASKYYIEEDEIRIMFSKLIASSLDASKNDINHSSYVEIIKQLNPLDAKILSEIFNGNTAIGQVGFDLLPTGHTIQVNHLFIPKFVNSTLANIEASIDNLVRLGLVSVTYGTFSTVESHYDNLRNSKKFKELENIMQSIKDSKAAIEDGKIPENTIGKLKNFKQLKFDKGLVETTKYGKNFCEICLPK